MVMCIDQAVACLCMNVEFNSNNTLVCHAENISTMLYHHVCIARIDWQTKKIMLMTHGFNTKSTCARLNAIVQKLFVNARCFIKQGKTYLDINGNIQALPITVKFDGVMI